MALSCGFPDCSRYLENASSQQNQIHCPESPMSSLVNTTMPSAHDITANNIHPCVITQGINAGKLPPTPQAFDSSILSPKVNGFHNHQDNIIPNGEAETLTFQEIIVSPARSGDTMDSSSSSASAEIYC